MWRLNASQLKEQGVHYHVPEKIDGGGFGKITSGNGGLALRGPDELTAALGCEDNLSCLLTSEHFFTQLASGENLNFLVKTASQNGFKRVKVLMFVREPISLMSSLYDQYLKRANGKLTIEEFYQNQSIDVTPVKTRQVIEKVSVLEGVDLKVINYTHNKRNILDLSSQWMGIDPAKFGAPENHTVNRSLSSGERELLRQLNQVCARDAISLANDLCEKLPTIKSDQIIPPEKVQQSFIENNGDHFEVIQQALPSDQPLRLELQNPTDANGFHFDREQLAEIVKYLVRFQKKQGFVASKLRSFRRRFGI